MSRAGMHRSGCSDQRRECSTRGRNRRKTLRGVRSFGMRLPRGGFVVHYVALSICLVVATAIAVAAVIIQASGQLIERDADRRLADGATLVQASLDEDQEDLAAVGAWLQQDPSFVDAV